MKKLIFATLIIFSNTVFSQSTYTDEAGKWRLGLNMGAMWQTCDVSPHANIAGGFTIEKILNKRSDAIIGFALGLRYLSGHCTGLDTKASYGVANNTALNGTYDSKTDYAHNGGIFYNNYKTYIHEGALELKVNFPRFEQKTNLILYLMGGVGVCNYKTWINALDKNGDRYDFTALQNAKNVTASDVRKVLNGSYSTLAQGSSPGGTYRFTPSVGIGFGFKLSRVVALVFEYRAAFQRTNLLDGVTYNNFNDPVKQNDFYNYASAHLLFTLYGKTKNSSYSNSHTNTYTQAQTNNTVYTNQQPLQQPQPTYNQQSIYNQQPQTGYTNQQVYPPYVNISYPQNNFSSTGDYVTVQANVQNIQSAQQVNISQNGYPVRNFTYDSYSGNVHFQTFLQHGANNIIITANNPYGTGSQGVVVFYNPAYVPNTNQANLNPNFEGNTNTTNNIPPVNNTLPPNHTAVLIVKKPIVQYLNPTMSPEDVTTSLFNVTASVLNVGAANQITVSFNGSNVQQFNYNPTAKTVNFSVNLLTGYNSINISASNVSGTDAKSTVIDYKPVGKPPRIDVFNPATSPFTSVNQNMVVSGYVYNVASASDIAANYNGSNVSFNYNTTTHEIDVPVNLSSNSNQLQITATNAFGNDVKQVTLLLLNLNTTIHPHTVTTETGSPVFGNIHSQSPINTNQSTPSGGQTGTTATNGNTNGTNMNGLGQHHNKPEFLLTSPGTNPFTSMSGAISISANLNYIMDVSKVSITYNGAPVSFSFNPAVSLHLSFTSPLKPGSNVFVINASNPFGSISESVEINYIPTNPNGNVNGNPTLHFNGGTNNATNTPRVFVNTVNPTPTTLPTTTPSKTIQEQPINSGRPIMRPR